MLIEQMLGSMTPFLDSTPKENRETFTAILPPFRWSQPMHSKHAGGKLLG